MDKDFQDIERVFYNGNEVERVFYNGQEIVKNIYYRFSNEKSRIGQTELSYQCGVGEAKVNVYTGRLSLIHPDINIGAGNFEIGISHIYNSSWSTKFDNVMGNGWKLNLQQYCYPYDDNDEERLLGYEKGDYVYIDAEGYKHRFVIYKEKDGVAYYYDDAKNNLILKKISESELEISDPTGSTLCFNKDGQLYSIVSPYNTTIVKHIEYKDGKIDSVYDKRNSNRVLYFKYNKEDLLSEISCEENSIIIKTLHYFYDSDNNLIRITQQVNTSTKTVAFFSYDSNDLIHIMDGEDNSAILFSYKNFDDKYVTNVKIGIGKKTFSNSSKIDLKEIKNETKFDYESTSNTLVTTEKGITYLYQFNKRGFTSAIFEKDGHNLRTLTKENGWSLSNGNQTTSINGKHSEIVYGETYLLTKEKLYNFLNIFAGATNYSYVENYTLSFWIKLKSVVYNDVLARLKIITVPALQEVTLNFKSRIDHTAYDVWQHVTIPIDFQLFEANYDNSVDYSESGIQNEVPKLKENINEMRISLEGIPLDSSFEIADIQIAVGSQNHLVIDGKNFEDADYIYCYIGNKCEKKAINSNFFMTLQDVVLTYLNMHKCANENDKFDMVACDGTKVIEVNAISFTTPKFNECKFKFSDDGKPNFYLVCKNRKAQSQWLVTETDFTFRNDYIEQRTSVDVIEKYYICIDENSKSRNYSWYFYNGLLKAQKDAYGVITENKYDDYGNLIEIVIYNENDSNKLIRTITFDEFQPNDSKLSKVQYQINDNGVLSKQTFNLPFFQLDSETVFNGDTTLYEKCYIYDDIFGDKLTKISVKSDLKKIDTYFKYTDEGYLNDISNDFKNHYQFEYDIFGDITSYNLIDEDNNVTELLQKENINYDNHFEAIIEKYPSDDSSFTREYLYDQYNRLTSIRENEEHIKFDYESNEESRMLAQVEYIDDPYTKQKNVIKYDSNTGLYTYSTINEESSTSNQGLSIVQIGQNKTKYILCDGENKTERISEFIYDDNEEIENKIYLNPRLAKTKDYLVDNESEEFNFSYEWDGLGRLKKQQYSDETKFYEYSYNDCGRINKVEFHFNENNFIFQYTYDSIGNIKTIKENINNDNKIEYTYDSFNQLLSEVNSKLGINNKYTYDSKGRLYEINKNNSTKKIFNYDSKGRLIELQSGNTTYKYTYTSNGNLEKIFINQLDTQDTLEHVLIWERHSLLKEYDKNQYFYNYQGIRYKKIVNGITKFYYLSGEKILGEDWSNGIKIRYFYDANGIAGFTYKGKTYHYIKDIQQNIRAIQKEGDIICTYEYDAYGNCYTATYEDIDDIATINPFRYRGYYFDVETGLYYCNSRYYSPELGRFLQVSDVSELNPHSINGLNLYAYANNNPIGIAYSSSNIGGRVGGSKVSTLALGGLIGGGGSSFAGSNNLSIKFPSQNWLSLGIDFTAGMSGALSVLGWTLKNPEFYEFWYSAYGISKYEMLSNLKSPMTKIASVISYGLVAYDTYTDVMGHINAGDSWQKTTASGMVTAGVGVFNVWASAKVGAAVGTAIGGVPGFIIGTAAGVVVGIVINGIFYTEINGKSIAGHIEDGIEWFLEWIS